MDSKRFLQNNTKNRLDLVEAVFALSDQCELNDLIIIGAQHILPSTLSMLGSFFDRGLRPENVFLIGKCYSTDFNTYVQLQDLGVFVCPSSLSFNQLISFDLFYKYNIKNFAIQVISRISKHKKCKIVVLDDGGDLISYINQYVDKKNFNLTSLEQTSSGYEKLKKLDLQVGIINVARSFAKLQFESKIVAKSAIQAIYEKLFNRDISPKNVVIFGNGAIGGALANGLEGLTNVSLADISPNKSDRPYEYYLNNLSNFDLIIGCVGKTILSKDQIKKLAPETTLVSLSSSDREFDIIDFRSQSKLIHSCHSDFECHNRVLVLNCGFPVNFNGDASKVDIKEFELTRSLLALGILQSLSHSLEKGFISLDHEIQLELIKKYSSKYKDYESSIIKPNFKENEKLIN